MGATGKVIGYARASTLDQSTTIQVEALRKAGADLVVEELKSGTTREGRVELERLLAFIREGDTLLITRLDRLARSVGDLFDIVRLLEKKGVALRAVEQAVDTGSASGRAFVGMLAVFSEFETNLRRERQIEGIRAAQRRGVYRGRPASIDADAVRALKVQGLGATEIAKRLGVGRASVYRMLAKG